MKFKKYHQIALVYGEKKMVKEFLESFNWDRMHDDAPIKAILVRGDMKKELKHFLWKGD